MSLFLPDPINPPSEDGDVQPLKDWSTLIAVIGPLSWLGLPLMMMGGGFASMFGMYLGIALLLFWHMAGPIVLLVNGVFRYRRGLGIGSGTPFGMCYFLVMIFIAFFLEGGRVFIFIEILMKEAFGLLVLIGVSSIVLLAIGAYQLHTKGDKKVGSGTVFWTSLSTAGAITVLIVYGLSFVPMSLSKKKIILHVLDASSHQPVTGADIEFVEHMENAKREHQKTDKAGTGKLFGWNTVRIAITKDGYRDQVAWFENGTVNVCWLGNDGWMTPFRTFTIPSRRDNESRDLTLYLQSMKDNSNMPYLFKYKKPENICTTLMHPFDSSRNGSDPNQLDPSGLPEPVKRRLLSYQQRSESMEKRFLMRGPTKNEPAPGWETRKGKLMLWGYWKRYDQRDTLAMAIFAMSETMDEASAYESADELLPLLQKRDYMATYTTYTNEHPQSPIGPYCYLAALVECRDTFSWKTTAIREGHNIHPTEEARYNEKVKQFDELHKEVSKQTDPLVRYMAEEIFKTPNTSPYLR